MPYLLKTLTTNEIKRLNTDDYEYIYTQDDDDIYIKTLKHDQETTSRIKTRSKLNDNIDEYIVRYNSSSNNENDNDTTEDKPVFQILTNRYKEIPKSDLDQMKYEYIKMLEIISVDDDTFLEFYINLIKDKCSSDVWSLQIYGTEVGSGTLETDVVAKDEGVVHIFAKTFISTKEDYDTSSTNPVWSFDIHEIYKLCSYKLNPRYLIEGIIPKNKTGILISVLEQHKDGNTILRGIRVTKLRGIGTNPLGVYMCSSRMGKFLQKHTEDVICNIKQHIHAPKKQRTSKNDMSKFLSLPQFYELYAIEDAVGFWQHIGFTKTLKQKANDGKPQEFKTKVIGSKTTYHMTKPICM